MGRLFGDWATRCVMASVFSAPAHATTRRWPSRKKNKDRHWKIRQEQALRGSFVTEDVFLGFIAVVPSKFPTGALQPRPECRAIPAPASGNGDGAETGTQLVSVTSCVPVSSPPCRNDRPIWEIRAK